MYELSGGDFTKFDSAKKMKVSEASVIMMIKEINAFKKWYQYEANKPQNG